MSEAGPVTRRAAIGALTAASYSRVSGANNRIGVGFIGYGLIGAQHVFDFKSQDDADLVGLAETYEPRLREGIAACEARPGTKTRGYRDFRRLLDEKDIDAVVVSTPDHWHALLTMMACAAGKDVYVEKPMTLFVREGRWMTQVARRHKRVVQVGTQQRSGVHYQAARKLIQEQYFGKLLGPHGRLPQHHARLWQTSGTAARELRLRHVARSCARPGLPAPPRPLPFPLVLGFLRRPDDQPRRPRTRHSPMDDRPERSAGCLLFRRPLRPRGRRGNRPIPRTPSSNTTNSLPSGPIAKPVWAAARPAAASTPAPREPCSSTAPASKYCPTRKCRPGNAIPVFKGQPQGGPKRETVTPEPWVQAMKVPGSSDDQFRAHVRNFLDCIKSRERTVADVEDGHQTAVACHLANISLRTGRKIRWDPEKEEILNDPEASAMLERPYRKPWDRVLKGLLSVNWGGSCYLK
ncbi:MAG: Gfo/Idh/MocA family oxidoreductase [Paludibaculum sp.]